MSTSISLGHLIQLVVAELNQTVAATIAASHLETVEAFQVNDIELDLPAHVQLRTTPSTAIAAPLMLTLPSALETLSVGRLGRVRITIKLE